MPRARPARWKRARIEQLENQLLRLQTQADRLAGEQQTVQQSQQRAPLDELHERERAAGELAAQTEQTLAEALTAIQQLRAAQHAAEAELEQLRAGRERTRAELMSLEALQQAALGERDPAAAAWVEGYAQRSGQGALARAAALLNVAGGWEQAVETVLGDYLEALCVDDLDALGDELRKIERGNLTFLELGGHASVAGDRSGATLADQVRGPEAVLARLAGVRTCDSLAEALRARRGLPTGESLITRNGEWVGRDWLRLRRGVDPHAGVLEREQRLKSLAQQHQQAEDGLRGAEARLEQLRAQVMTAEQRREAAQEQIQHSHREHGELRAQLGALQARHDENSLRRLRVDADLAEVHSSWRARMPGSRLRDAPTRRRSNSCSSSTSVIRRCWPSATIIATAMPAHAVPRKPLSSRCAMR